MSITKNGSTVEVGIEGSIGESSILFGADVRQATKIIVNGAKMTYISSVGVKNWILWLGRIPKTAIVSLINMPIVMVNQVSTVQGFLRSNDVVDSFFAPYTCESCNNEVLHRLNNGKEYSYGPPITVSLPKIQCPKCRKEMEADIVESKTFAFLQRK